MTATTSTTRTGGVVDKGLRPGTLGLLSSVVIGVASAAPAYSLAATLVVEISAALRRVLLTVEAIMLVVFAVVALVRVGLGAAPAGFLTPSLSWFNPLEIGSLGTLATGVLLMIFIYWGWDSTVSVNEETADSEHTPGRAAVMATVLLVAIYVVTTVAAQSFAGVGTDGIGLANPDNFGDVLGSVGATVFGDTMIGKIPVDLLLLVVLTSAAASTQTTILPTARTTLSMAAYRALPQSFARINPRFFTPTVSTWGMGIVSVAIYIGFNFRSGGSLVYDAVSAIGITIGLHHGITGFACAWLFRRTYGNPRHLLVRGVIPFLGGVILFVAVGYTAVTSWSPDYSTTFWTVPGTSMEIGGVFIPGVGSMLVGFPLAVAMRLHSPDFFRGGPPGKGLPASPTTPLTVP